MHKNYIKYGYTVYLVKLHESIHPYCHTVWEGRSHMCWMIQNLTLPALCQPMAYSQSGVIAFAEKCIQTYIDQYTFSTSCVLWCVSVSCTQMVCLRMTNNDPG